MPQRKGDDAKGSCHRHRAPSTKHRQIGAKNHHPPTQHSFKSCRRPRLHTNNHALNSPNPPALFGRRIFYVFIGDNWGFYSKVKLPEASFILNSKLGSSEFFPELPHRGNFTAKQFHPPKADFTFSKRKFHFFKSLHPLIPPDFSSRAFR